MSKKIEVVNKPQETKNEILNLNQKEVSDNSITWELADDGLVSTRVANELVRNGLSIGVGLKCKFTVIDDVVPQLNEIQTCLLACIRAFFANNPTGIIFEADVKKFFFLHQVKLIAQKCNCDEKLIKEIAVVNPDVLPTTKDVFTVCCYAQRFLNEYYSVRLSSGMYTIKLMNDEIPLYNRLSVVEYMTQDFIDKEKEQRFAQLLQRQKDIDLIMSRDGVSLDTARKTYNRERKSVELQHKAYEFSKFVLVKKVDK